VSYFVLGLALLAGFMLAGRWFVSAEPKTLVKVFKWLSLIVLITVGLFLAITGRLGWALFTLPVLLGWFMRFRSLARTAKNFSRMASSARGGGMGNGASEVETRFLKMALQHESGDMDGEILDGPFRGRFLSSLGFEQLMDLLRLCWQEDEPSSRVLEAYMDRLYPDWRERAQDKGNPSAQGGPMSRQEALDVLGLAEGACEEDIKDAHHRLMSGLHPDHGGSTYLASKINQAKDVLLGT